MHFCKLLMSHLYINIQGRPVVPNLAGKITKEQIADAEEKDLPPPYRLACQFIARNEDVLVKF